MLRAFVFHYLWRRQQISTSVRTSWNYQLCMCICMYVDVTFDISIISHFSTFLNVLIILFFSTLRRKWLLNETCLFNLYPITKMHLLCMLSDHDYRGLSQYRF
jgi:hypothetical protein